MTRACDSDSTCQVPRWILLNFCVPLIKLARKCVCFSVRKTPLCMVIVCCNLDNLVFSL